MSRFTFIRPDFAGDIVCAVLRDAESAKEFRYAVLDVIRKPELNQGLNEADLSMVAGLLAAQNGYLQDCGC